MILLIEYFVPDSKERLDEYLRCLSSNINNSYIDKIEVFISDNSKLEIESDKININIRKNRPTYNDFFEFCNINHIGEICIISNSDIMFDNTLVFITDNNINNKFLALTRWDINNSGKPVIFQAEAGNSQDAWIFKSPVSMKTNTEFTLGILGCDNRIAYIAHESGYNVCNPAYSIIIKHLHTTGYRTISAESKRTIGGYHLVISANNNIDVNSNKRVLYHKV